MNKITFSTAEKDLLVSKIESYFHAELNQEIGQFDAEFLLDFFSQELGAYYYNRGLSDARTVLAAKLDDVDASIYELEKPTEFSK
ncbi:MAG: hypothetical protein COA90_02610 [Gammaproteobacteria bacterium]|nr:MAG: hypothetical protein COA90_02610 [Gammaproteobacteria bacterium]